MSEYNYLEWYWSHRSYKELKQMINDEELLDSHRKDAQEELNKRRFI